MRLVLEFMSLAYVLILVYLVLSHGRQTARLGNVAFGGANRLIRSLQGR